MDRRVQATQQKLVQALRLLMQRYPWESITVAMICQESEISRSTFYSHFSSKEDIMQLSLDFLARELAPTDTRRGLHSTCTLKFLPAFLQHVQSHREILVKNKNSAAAGLIQQNMRKTIEGLVNTEIQCSPFASSVNHGILGFICGGLNAMIERWAEDECPESVDSILITIDTQIKKALQSA